MRYLIITMLIIATMITTDMMAGEPSFPVTDFKVEVYPQEIKLGDTIYIRVTAMNPHKEGVAISDLVLECNDVGFVNFSVYDPNRKIEFPLRVKETRDEYELILIYVEIPAGNKREIAKISFSVPDLDDLHEPFWKELFGKNNIQEKKLILRTTIDSKHASDIRGTNEVHNKITLETPITIKPRSAVEMTMLEKWHKDFPPEFFLENWGCRKAFPPKATITYYDRKTIQTQHNGKRFTWTEGFTTDYPGAPNIPTTTRGWRALEESLEPSTLRDEIQLTRLLWEYFTAKDSIWSYFCADESTQEKKLAEIKTWFESRPKLQAYVIAKNLLKNIEDFAPYTSRLYSNFYLYGLPPRTSMKKSLLYAPAQKLKPVIEKFADADKSR